MLGWRRNISALCGIGRGSGILDETARAFHECHANMEIMGIRSLYKLDTSVYYLPLADLACKNRLLCINFMINVPAILGQ